MCGISGIYNRSNGEVSNHRIVTMGRTLDHRGPDNFSVFTDRNVALAANRLSIVDLTPAGNQPFTNERYSLVYNGEIYNYLDLKKQLAKTFGVQFRSTSDTEVLFHHLIQLGVDETLARVKGMYAFAFFDRITRRLVLARDRFGIKPVYWYEKDSEFFFASEIKAIAAVARLDVDPVPLLFSLTGGSEGSAESTLFKHVKPVKPGTFLTVDPAGEPRETTYYSLQNEFDPQYSGELGRMSRNSINEVFSDLLTRSVVSMLMSDAPMGVFVSGGIDSSVITAIAGRTHDVMLFTADVLGEYSELEAAKSLADAMNSELHIYSYEPQDFLRDLAVATYHYECPVVSFANAIPLLNVAKVAREHGAKAVLTGEGADEIFHGYPRLLTRQFDNLVRLPLDGVKALYRSIPKLASYVKLDGQLTQTDFLALLTRNFQQEADREAFAHRGSLPNDPGLDQYFTTIGMFNPHLLGLLHRSDRMGMLASIESRFPYLDEDIVRFGINLPAKFKSRRTWRLHNYKHPFIVDKAPVRDVAAGLLSRSLVQRKKWGFSVIAQETLRVKAGFFSAGIIGELCGLTKKGEAHLLAQMPQYYVGKLVSVEVFGRIFSGGAGIDEVSRALQCYVSMEARGINPTRCPESSAGSNDVGLTLASVPVSASSDYSSCPEFLQSMGFFW